MTEYPPSWVSVRLGEICAINPPTNKTSIDVESVVSFVPMSNVEAETGKIDVGETRPFASVRNGYKTFRQGDVLFAKITPCMENGKMAVVPGLVSEYGFGSTEFHVLRPAFGIDSRFIYYAISNREFRIHAERSMTGAVGQRRVPATFLQEHEIGLPSSEEQRRIADKIEELFKEIDRSVDSLQAAKNALELYRQSLLKSAFEGRLTARWREKNRDKLESPDALLKRIQDEREANYQASLAEWLQDCTKWRELGKGKKPTKPKKPKFETTHPLVEVIQTSTLPSAWVAAKVVTVLDVVSGATPKNIHSCVGSDIPFFKISDMNSEGNETELIHASLKLSAGEAQALGLRIFPSETTVFPKRGGAILTNKKRQLHQPSCLDLNTMGLVNQTDTVLKSFVKYWMAGLDLSTIFDGSNVPQINNKNIEPLSFPICSPPEQAEVVRILDSNLKVVNELSTETDSALASAEVLRQSILKMAFSGQLVSQDCKDEPASVLLERLRTNRARTQTIKKGEKSDAS